MPTSLSAPRKRPQAKFELLAPEQDPVAIKVAEIEANIERVNKIRHQARKKLLIVPMREIDVRKVTHLVAEDLVRCRREGLYKEHYKERRGSGRTGLNYLWDLEGIAKLCIDLNK